MAIAMHNHGVELEHLKLSESAAKAYNQAAVTAEMYFGPSHPTTVAMLKACLTCEDEQTPTRRQRPKTREHRPSSAHTIAHSIGGSSCERVDLDEVGSLRDWITEDEDSSRRDAEPPTRMRMSSMGNPRARPGSAKSLASVPEDEREREALRSVAGMFFEDEEDSEEEPLDGFMGEEEGLEGDWEDSSARPLAAAQNEEIDLQNEDMEFDDEFMEVMSILQSTRPRPSEEAGDVAEMAEAASSGRDEEQVGTNDEATRRTDEGGEEEGEMEVADERGEYDEHGHRSRTKHHHTPGLGQSGGMNWQIQGFPMQIPDKAQHGATAAPAKEEEASSSPRRQSTIRDHEVAHVTLHTGVQNEIGLAMEKAKRDRKYL